MVDVIAVKLLFFIIVAWLSYGMLATAVSIYGKKKRLPLKEKIRNRIQSYLGISRLEFLAARPDPQLDYRISLLEAWQRNNLIIGGIDHHIKGNSTVIIAGRFGNQDKVEIYHTHFRSVQELTQFRNHLKAMMPDVDCRPILLDTPIRLLGPWTAEKSREQKRGKPKDG